MAEEGLYDKVNLYSNLILKLSEKFGIQNCISVYINNLIQLWMIQPEVKESIFHLIFFSTKHENRF